ncbi:MAG TPA: SdrD B-like domain-containing protein [Isosphaeraceae bacterium]|nr:SdrD B-like domain-containing protein [Isosphaeraceae bacterium]
MQRRRTPVASAVRKAKPQRRFALAAEVLEERQLLSVGEFFQGLVTAGGLPQAGATIELLTADGSTVLGQTTSDVNGEYLLDDSKVNAVLLPSGIQPNTTYLLKEIPPSGFTNNTDSFLDQIDTVSVVDNATLSIALAPGPQTVTINALSPGSIQTVGLTPGGPTTDWLGQMAISTSPNAGGGTSSFLSVCADAFSDTPTHVPFSTMLQPSSTFFPLNADNIAYLYNKYGTSAQSPTLAAALQLATWKLESDPIPNFNNVDFTTGKIVFPTPFGSTDPNILATAQSLIAESAGKHAVALVFDARLGNPVTGQSELATRSFNFDNKPVPNTGSISGIKFDDLTGNGLTAADTPLGGVTINLFSVDSHGNQTFVTSAVTDATTGAYSFTQLSPGKYVVQEAVPNGWVRTFPVSSDGYTVTLAAGQAVTNENFADFQKCDPGDEGNVSYKIQDGCHTYYVSNLRGNVHQGDTVSATFTLPAGETDTVSLVSYTAPGSTFVASQASQQMVYDMVTQTFTGGTHTLTVDVPNCYFQVDFVCGPVIDKFGPAGSNIFYTPQGRLISADNGGSCDCGTPKLDDNTATIGFWANSNGQALINSLNGGPNATNLATWLSTNFPHLFPTSLIGTTNTSVASYIKTIKGVSGNKVEAQVMAVALADYVTNANLAGGTMAEPYGFHVTFSGLDSIKFNSGSAGTLLGLQNNTSYTISALLQAADSVAVNGTIFSGSNSKRGTVETLFNNINTTGDI